MKYLMEMVIYLENENVAECNIKGNDLVALKSNIDAFVRCFCVTNNINGNVAVNVRFEDEKGEYVDSEEYYLFAESKDGESKITYCE